MNCYLNTKAWRKCLNVVAMLGLAGAAHAQTLPSSQLEEILVTAQKRSESLENVPIAVTALTANDAKAQGVVNTLDLNVVVPGINIQRNTDGPVIYTRGVGLQAPTAGNENVTAIYVDGIYYMDPSAGILSFNNIDRIEVLKGPQGTLFGRNATAGLINIITKEPSHDDSGEVSVGYGNFDTSTVSAYLTGGLSATLAGDIAVYSTHQGDGWGRNLVTGNYTYQRNEQDVRSKLLFDPSTDLKVTLEGDYSYVSDNTGIAKQAIPGAVLPHGFTGPSDIYDITENIDPEAKMHNFGGYARVDYNLGWANFSSLSGYRRSEDHALYDQVAAPVALVNLQFDPNEATWATEELQLLSPASSRIKWIAGLFYLNAHAGYDPLRETGALVPVAYVDVYGFQDTNSYSAFAQTTLPLSDRDNLTLGVRETADHRRAHGFDVTPHGISDVSDLSHTWRSPTWRLALDHEIIDHVLTYISYDRGFKSGVYNTTALSPAAKPVDPETLDAFEVGLKSDLLHSRLRINAAAFYYNYKNEQLQENNSGSVLLLNAANSHIYGGEIELTGQVSEGLKANIGVSLLHARYTDFENAPCTVPKPTGGNTIVICDAAGFAMIHAPDMTGNVSVDYTRPIPSGALSANVTYYYNNGFYWDPGNRLFQSSYGLANARLGYHNDRGNWGVDLWGNNLFGKEYYAFVSSANIGDTGSPGAPRTYGITADYKF